MFRGPANLIRRNPQIKQVFWGAGALCLLLAAALMLLPIPREMKVIAVTAAGVAMITIYPRMLSRAFKPKFVSVDLYVDQSGVYADGAPLALREDIAQAYIRPAFEERTMRFRGYKPGFGLSGYYSFFITTPSLPLTVELTTCEGGDLHIDPGGQEAAANILTALGVPVTMCAPQDTPENRALKTSGRQWVKTVLVAVLFFAALFGFAYYKSTGH
jgi:hypothetical protein